MTAINDVISIQVDGDIGVILSNNPPVNALGHAVRDGLVQAIEALEANSAVKAIVLACEGRTFFAGADITEFGKPKKHPYLVATIARIGASTKPVVAAIHGTALGGGFEVALGCHFRVAVPSAALGLPEITLGLFAGAGGTQLLPRLIGPEAALDVCLSGRQFKAREALELGILDGVEDGEPVAIGKAFARRVIDQGLSAVPVRERTEKIEATRKDPAAFNAKADAALKKARGQEAPAANIAAIRRSFELSFDEAIAIDAEENTRLMAGFQSKALRHQFFAEREAMRIPDLPADVKPREIKKVAVLGAGTMGGGIAMSFINAGVPVVLIDATEEALNAGMARIRGNYETSVKRGSLTADAMEKRLSLLTGAFDRQAAHDVDLVVEAVFENMDLKKEIFSDLARICGPDTILSSNTSALDVDEIAAVLPRPENFIGMHFFAPANVMKLLEVVRAAKSSPETIVSCMNIGRQIKKVPVLAGNCDGFIGNRIIAKRSAAVDRLLLAGAMPREIDGAIRSFGYPMGPLETNDMSGLDVGWSIRKRRGTPFPIADAICEKGWFGQKTGKGYYLYEAGSRTPLHNPEVEALILEISGAQGVTRKSFTREDIIERLLFPLINESARVVEEGIAIRPSDVDVTYTNGYGWPRWTGGPLFYADEVGLSRIVERLEVFRAEYNDPSLEPAKLLRQLAEQGRSFAEWQKNRG